MHSPSASLPLLFDSFSRWSTSQSVLSHTRSLPRLIVPAPLIFAEASTLPRKGAACSGSGRPDLGGGDGSHTRFIYLHSFIPVGFDVAEVEALDASGANVALGKAAEIRPASPGGAAAAVDGDTSTFASALWVNDGTANSEPPASLTVDLGREHHLVKVRVHARANFPQRLDLVTLSLVDAHRRVHAEYLLPSTLMFEADLPAAARYPREFVYQNHNRVGPATITDLAAFSFDDVRNTQPTGHTASARFGDVEAPAGADNNDATHVQPFSGGGYVVAVKPSSPHFKYAVLKSLAGTHANLEGGHFYMLDGARKIQAQWVTRGVPVQRFDVVYVRERSPRVASVLLRAAQWNDPIAVAELELYDRKTKRNLFREPGVALRGSGPILGGSPLSNAVDGSYETNGELNLANWPAQPHLQATLPAAVSEASDAAALWVSSGSSTTGAGLFAAKVYWVAADRRVVRGFVLGGRFQRRQCLAWTDADRETFCDFGRGAARYLVLDAPIFGAAHWRTVSLFDAVRGDVAVGTNADFVEPLAPSFTTPGGVLFSGGALCVDGNNNTEGHSHWQQSSTAGNLPPAVFYIDLGEEAHHDFNLESVEFTNTWDLRHRVSMATVSLVAANWTVLASFVMGNVGNTEAFNLGMIPRVGETTTGQPRAPVRYVGVYQGLRMGRLSMSEIDVVTTSGANAALGRHAVALLPHDQWRRQAPAVTDGNAATFHFDGPSLGAWGGFEVDLAADRNDIATIRFRAMQDATASQSLRGGRAYTLDGNRRLLDHFVTEPAADQSFALPPAAPLDDLKIRAVIITTPSWTWQLELTDVELVDAAGRDIAAALSSSLEVSSHHGAAPGRSMSNAADNDIRTSAATDAPGAWPGLQVYRIEIPTAVSPGGEDVRAVRVRGPGDGARAQGNWTFARLEWIAHDGRVVRRHSLGGYRGQCIGRTTADHERLCQGNAPALRRAQQRIARDTTATSSQRSAAQWALSRTGVRFIAVHSNWDMALHFEEVEVWTTAGVNVARAAATRQWMVEPDAAFDLAHCFDGRYGADLPPGQVCHSLHRQTPAPLDPSNLPPTALAIDLGEVRFDVERITIHARGALEHRSMFHTLSVFGPGRETARHQFLLDFLTKGQVFFLSEHNASFAAAPSMVRYVAVMWTSRTSPALSELEVLDASGTNVARGKTAHSGDTTYALGASAPPELHPEIVDGDPSTTATRGGTFGGFEVDLGAPYDSLRSVVVRNTAGSHPAMRGARVLVLDWQRRVVAEFVHGNAAVETFLLTEATAAVPESTLRPAAVVVRASTWTYPLAVSEIQLVATVPTASVSDAAAAIQRYVDGGACAPSSGDASTASNTLRDASGSSQEAPSRPLVQGVDGDDVSAAEIPASLSGIPWLRYDVAAAHLHGPSNTVSSLAAHAFRFRVPETADSMPGNVSLSRVDFLFGSGRVMRSLLLLGRGVQCISFSAAGEALCGGPGLSDASEPRPMQGQFGTGTTTDGPSGNPSVTDAMHRAAMVRFVTLHNHWDQTYDIQEIEAFSADGNDNVASGGDRSLQPSWTTPLRSVVGFSDHSTEARYAASHCTDGDYDSVCHAGGHDELSPHVLTLDLRVPRRLSSITVVTRRAHLARSDGVTLSLFNDDRELLAQFTMRPMTNVQHFDVGPALMAPQSALPLGARPRCVQGAAVLWYRRARPTLSTLSLTTAGGVDAAAGRPAVVLRPNKAETSATTAPTAAAITDGNDATFVTGSEDYGGFSVPLASPADIASVSLRAPNAAAGASLESGRLLVFDTNRRVVAEFVLASATAQVYALSEPGLGPHPFTLSHWTAPQAISPSVVPWAGAARALRETAAVRHVQYRSPQWQWGVFVPELSVNAPPPTWTAADRLGPRAVRESMANVALSSTLSSAHVITTPAAAIDGDLDTSAFLVDSGPGAANPALPFVTATLADATQRDIASATMVVGHSNTARQIAGGRFDAVAASGRVLSTSLLDYRHDRPQQSPFAIAAPSSVAAAQLRLNSARTTTAHGALPGHGVEGVSMVLLQMNWDYVMDSAEIEVFNDENVNVALWKGADMPDGHQNLLPRINDGDYNNFAHSDLPYPTPLLIDLDGVHNVTSVVVTHRSTQQKRGSMLSLYLVSPHGRALREYLTRGMRRFESFAADGPAVLDPSVRPRHAKYVVFQNIAFEIVSISELEVFNTAGVNVGLASAGTVGWFHQPDTWRRRTSAGNDGDTTTHAAATRRFGALERPPPAMTSPTSSSGTPQAHSRRSEVAVSSFSTATAASWSRSSSRATRRPRGSTSWRRRTLQAPSPWQGSTSDRLGGRSRWT